MSQNEPHESSCPHGGDCQSCSGKVSLIRTLALFVFIAVAFALANGKLKPFQSPDRVDDGQQTTQIQIPVRPEKSNNNANASQYGNRLPIDNSTGNSNNSNTAGKNTAAVPDLSSTASSPISPSDDAVVASKLRGLAPIAYPFKEANRLSNATRAAKKITIEYKRVGAKLPDNETVDLTATLERIAEGRHDHHRNDGTEFRNRERRLPSRQSYYYTEFVHRVSKGLSPGACRVIIGQEGDIWYTPDHYQSFVAVNDEARDAYLQQKEKGRR